MADLFANSKGGMTGPGTNAEEADYTVYDHDFTYTTRYLKCSASSVLKVDMAGVGTNISLPVVPGVNPERVTKIYNSGSTAMTVTGIW